MPDAMNDTDETIIAALRASSRRGNSVADMYHYLKDRLIRSGDYHALRVVHYFRRAFALTFYETKPILALIIAEDRSITDEGLLHHLVFPAIERHGSEWGR